jgi:hypothetical protein
VFVEIGAIVLLHSQTVNLACALYTITRNAAGNTSNVSNSTQRTMSLSLSALGASIVFANFDSHSAVQG